MQYYVFTENQLEAAARKWARIYNANGDLNAEEEEELFQIILRFMHSQQALEGGLIQQLDIEPADA